MAPDPSRTTRRVLDPYDRVSEVLFGLIMVLTFTGSLSITEAGREEVRTMLIAAGCAFGRITGRRPWVMGGAMVLLGGALVALTMALGG